MEKPAYLRIFNDIPYTLDATSKGQPLPFLTFLLDPETEGKGIPRRAEIMGDFLATRQIYSLSYPINAGNINAVVNYDYPGKTTVRSAPPINGLDLSAWAQIPSGKHRVVFVTRPFTDTPFIQLPAKARQNILIDTTIDFEAGEVYTMETLAKDIDRSIYGLYLRKESFIHEKFDDDKIYASFYNLSGVPSLYYNSLYCKDTLNANFTYMTYDDVTNGSSVYFNYYIPLFPYFDVPLTSINSRFSTNAPFVPIPVISKNYFWNYQGLLRGFSPLAPPPAGSSYLGSLPFVAITLRTPDGAFVKKHANDYISDKFAISLYSVGDPGRINQYDPDFVSNNGVDAFAALANFYLVANMNGKVDISPTINIVELIYGRAYHMQIQKLYSSPYKRQ
jgi:hypothetical protein